MTDNDEINELVKIQADKIAELEKQKKPLSDEEIWEWFEKNTALTKESALMIGRSIETKVRGEK
jgi:hypothetical protein